MAADFDLQGVIKLRDETKAGAESATANIEKFAESTEAAGKSTEAAGKGLKGFAGSLTELKSGIDLATGTLRTFAEVGKQSFEFTKHGAEVLQTRDSFDRLGVSLAAMRAATGGTVDDMTLMSSTLTLTAGASSTLQAALLQSAPQLLEIAKASNKLNPTLGDTAFLYDSLALGIKRASPMILDNLGLTISVSAAQEKYAASIGKAVTELTAEEKQIALLQGTLAAGNRLLEQAGGSTESAVDGFARLETATTNLTDSMAEALSGAGGLFDRLASGVNGLNSLQQALNFANKEFGVIDGTIAVVTDALGFQNTLLDQYRAGMVENGEVVAVTNSAMQDYSQTNSDVAAKLLQSKQVVNQYNQAMAIQEATSAAAARQSYELTAAQSAAAAASVSSLAIVNQYNQAMAIQETASAAAAQKSYDLATAQQAAAKAATEAQQSFLNGAAALGEYSTAQVAQAQIEALTAAKEAGLITDDQLVAAQQELLLGFGLLTPAEIAAQGRLDALTKLFVSGAIGIEEYTAKSLETKSALDTVTAAEAATAAEAQRLAEKNMTVAEKTQLMKEKAGEAESVLYGTAGGMRAAGDAAEAASGKVAALKAQIALLQDKIVTVTYRTIGDQEGNYTNAQADAAVEESKRRAGFATGGTIPVNGPVWVGENGPELITGAKGARVIDNTRSTQITNNFGGITVNSAAAMERLVQESRRARMMNVQI